MNLRSVTILILIVVLAVPGIQAQQGGTTIYVYDDNGRLVAVISPTGEAATYEYDAAGNFTAIRRFTANDLEILAFTPRQGPVGTAVTIYGTGFNQGVSAVSFNGLAATIASSTTASVVAVVPEGASTGPITVVTPRGTVTSTTQFIVRGVLVTPQLITIPALGNVSFNATVSGTPTNNLSWSVNGVDGGNQTVGTINGNGDYFAPNLGGGNSVQFTIRATSVDDPTIFGESGVIVVPAGEGFQFRASGVSVRYGTPANTSATYVNGALSVTFAAPPNAPPIFINNAVSVRYGTPPNQAQSFVAGAVSAGRGPILSSLAPGSLSRGATTTLSISGLSLTGTTSIRFFRLSNGSPENTITVANLNVNAQGTTATASITVPAAVAVGTYVVVVTTPAGSTMRNDVATNTVQVN